MLLVQNEISVSRDTSSLNGLSYSRKKDCGVFWFIVMVFNVISFVWLISQI